MLPPSPLLQQSDKYPVHTDAPGNIGHFGDPLWRPVVENLAAVADAHPAITFNLAVSLKVFSDAGDPKGEQMALAMKAARILGRPPQPLPPDWDRHGRWLGPHLRIVDPQVRETW